MIGHASNCLCKLMYPYTRHNGSYLRHLEDRVTAAEHTNVGSVVLWCCNMHTSFPASVSRKSVRFRGESGNFCFWNLILQLVAQASMCRRAATAAILLAPASGTLRMDPLVGMSMPCSSANLTNGWRSTHRCILTHSICISANYIV